MTCIPFTVFLQKGECWRWCSCLG